MKTMTHRFARTAMLLVLAMLTTNMWAQINLTQDANGNYLINNEADWNTLADYVKAGNTCQGMTFLMTDNIGTAANPITRPVGEQIGSTHADRKRFAGTFDGGGNTLTIALNTTDQYWSINPGYCAPFAYTVKTCTLLDLLLQRVLGPAVWSAQPVTVVLEPARLIAAKLPLRLLPIM